MSKEKSLMDTLEEISSIYELKGLEKPWIVTLKSKDVNSLRPLKQDGSVDMSVEMKEVMTANGLLTIHEIKE